MCTCITTIKIQRVLNYRGTCACVTTIRIQYVLNYRGTCTCITTIRLSPISCILDFPLSKSSVASPRFSASILNRRLRSSWFRLTCEISKTKKKSYFKMKELQYRKQILVNRIILTVTETGPHRHLRILLFASLSLLQFKKKC